jgi:hypothetical protein
LCGLCVGLLGVCVGVCALGVIRLPGANRVVLAGLMECVLHKRERVCVGVWSGVFTCVSLWSCLGMFGHSYPLSFPL